MLLEATLLLHSKLGAGIAREFLRFVGASGISELVIDEDINGQAKELFLEEEALSLTDASTIVLMKVVNAKNVATYDTRSFSRHHESIIGLGYWESLGPRERKSLSALLKEK